ncbi:MAG: ACT domain-containing protein [Thermodesulfobacteriota bacterium]|nr:ACT domain-containing protein [Thermodesulfobacteriota bacterium]
MTNRYIMTAFGKDRTGIVADVTRLLYENDCNLENTTMSMLADEFTLSLLFSSQLPAIEELLTRECRRLELDKKISAFVRPLQPQLKKNKENYKTCTIHIEGLDQAGIVYKTSQFLADHQLSIIQLDSAANPSPQSGAIIYNMTIYVQVPEKLPFDQLEEELTMVADELLVDITLQR